MTWYQFKAGYPILFELLKHWPITVFLPSILLMVAVLAMVTRWWDGRPQG